MTWRATLEGRLNRLKGLQWRARVEGDWVTFNRLIVLVRDVQAQIEALEAPRSATKVR